ncbi:MAG: hypothetical protein IJT62_04315 [Oscillospiraceae bacterium]|nr:hypothetical protein [Oscillospiraceae bacterium]
MVINGTNISMVRGDSETLTVTCSEPFAAGDAVTLTVREDVESPIALQKTVTVFGDYGEAVIEIQHEDTEGLDFGNYVYDIQLTRADGTVTTLVKVSRFTLEEEVTYGG